MSLAPESQLLDYPAGPGVAGHDRDLEPVEVNFLEGETAHHDERLGDVLVASLVLVHPVADVGASEGAAHHVGKVHLPDEGLGAVLTQEHAEAPTGA